MDEKEVIDSWLNMRQQQPVQLVTQEAYWQHYSILAAIAAMHAELSNPNNKFMACEDKKAIITGRAVRYANTLMTKLKKGAQNEQGTN